MMQDLKHVRTFNPGIGGECHQETVSRRSFMAGSGLLIAASLGGTLLPPDVLAAAKKTPQKLVKYQATPKNGRKCSGCTFFQPGDKSCKVVEGTVEPNGWCLRWAKKKA